MRKEYSWMMSQYQKQYQRGGRTIRLDPLERSMAKSAGELFARHADEVIGACF